MLPTKEKRECVVSQSRKKKRRRVCSIVGRAWSFTCDLFLCGQCKLAIIAA